MQLLKTTTKQTLSLLFFGAAIFAFQPVWAESDQQMYEQYLRNKEAKEKGGDIHAGHTQEDPSKMFHGVFYGFIPCSDCLGTKTTLSLNQNNNYLLVMQSAKEGSKEMYEKGKYVWDDEKKTVVLTPRKGGTNPRHFMIKSDEALVQLNEDGSQMEQSLADKFVLQRSDTVKNRQVHIH